MERRYGRIDIHHPFRFEVKRDADQRFVMRVFEGRGGLTRTLTAMDCGQLRDTALLFVGMAIESSPPTTPSVSPPRKRSRRPGTKRAAARRGPPTRSRLAKAETTVTTQPTTTAEAPVNNSDSDESPRTRAPEPDPTDAAASDAIEAGLARADRAPNTQSSGAKPRRRPRKPPRSRTRTTPRLSAARTIGRPNRRGELSWSLAGDLGLGVRNLFPTSLRIDLRTGLSGRNWSVRVGTRILPRGEIRIQDSGLDYGAGFVAVAGTMGGCYRPRLATGGGPVALHLPVCGDVALGSVWGRGVGDLVGATTQRLTWASLGVDLGVELGLSRGWAWTLHAGVEWLPKRTEFGFANGNSVCCHQGIAGHARTGVRFSSPIRRRAGGR